MRETGWNRLRNAWREYRRAGRVCDALDHINAAAKTLSSEGYRAEAISLVTVSASIADREVKLAELEKGGGF